MRGRGRGVTSSVASPVHHSDGQLAGGQQHEDPECCEHRIGNSVAAGLRQQRHRKGRRDHRDRAQVQQQRDPSRHPADNRGRGEPHLGGAFELPASLVEQIETDVGCPVVVAAAAGRADGALARQPDRHARDLAFGQLTVLRDLLHDVPVASRVAKSIMP